MPDQKLRILLADDDDMSREMFARILGEFTGCPIVQCANGAEALRQFEERPFPIVISDVRMPGLDGIGLLRGIRAHPDGSDSQVILISGFADMNVALAALREGASDMLAKPIAVTDLLNVVKKATRTWSARREEKRNLAEQAPPATGEPREGEKNLRTTVRLPDGSVIGVFSASMRAVTEAGLRYHQDRSIPVLIEGETGTGKEMVARIVHFGREERVDRPFVTVNCAAISPSLFESELFGYVGGAFTGALPKGAMGKLEAANGGTLFFDEVGEIPLPMQAKLLRALQDRAIYRVGGTDKVDLDIRVIAATNRNLETSVRTGEFRSDLYYRLAVGRLELPALRDQRPAIPALAQLFLAEFAQSKQRDFRFISREAVKMLEKYDWPGNIRQLRNLIEHAVLLHNAVELEAYHLAEFQHRLRSNEDYGGALLQPGAIQLPEGGLDLDGVVFEIVRKALDKFGGNQSRTAEFLGLTRGRLRTLLTHMDER